MVLLHALHQLGYEDLVVCHLDHQLRGSASQADATLVVTTAERLGYEWMIDSQPVAAKAEVEKISLETAARHARQAFFQHCAQQTGCGQIFLAHHADDQAETVLMQVLRGTGLRGLGGMRLVMPHAGGLEYVRPLLGLTRAALQAWASAQGIIYHEDATNQSADYQRNRLRHQLLPAAHAAMQRDVGPALARLADLAHADDAYLTELANAQFPPAERLVTAAVLAAPLSLQRRAIHAWLQHHGVPQISFALIESLRAILPPTARPAKINLPGGGHVRRRAGVLFIPDRRAVQAQDRIK